MAKAKRTPAILDNWSDAVDSVNYAKGTDVEVVKATKNNIPKANATPLFRYKNSKGNIGDWYAKVDVTIIPKKTNKNGKATTTQKGFTSEQLTKIQALMASGLL